MKKLSNKTLARINHNLEAIRQHQVNHPESSVRMLTVPELKRISGIGTDHFATSYIIRINNMLK